MGVDGREWGGRQARWRDSAHDGHRQRGQSDEGFTAPGVGSAEPGEKAAAIALENAGIEAVDLDMILFAPLSPEYSFPGSALFLQEMLGVVRRRQVCREEAVKAGVFAPCSRSRSIAEMRTLSKTLIHSGTLAQ